MAKTIIVDLDGTLADIGHRLKYVEPGKRKDWKSFFAEMHLDQLNEWCRELMLAMKNAGFRIDIVSGRPDDYKDVIIAWLKQYNVPFDGIHLRKGGDFRQDDIVKREILYADFKKDDVLFVVDDRPSVVKMWREEGLVCLQCDPHE
jgi:hypothetical protein